MRRANGPTAKVLELARNAPGGVITWSEAQGAYAQGVVPIRSRSGPQTQVQGAAAKHKMSISNVLKKHFTRVDGIRGTYVLRASIANPDWEEDMAVLQAFHDLYGSDEFGMSTGGMCGGPAYRGHETGLPVEPRLSRMSDIVLDWAGASVSIIGGDFNG